MFGDSGQGPKTAQEGYLTLPIAILDCFPRPYWGQARHWWRG